ncbi:MAG: NAD(P)-dependent glycerol-1-phosphate dehydrogenase [bacterium (Candidatus Stahlbacteria) CG23_combo_of_CG06-09_8_20_14_all_34_7]|nr:MAG: NAD(P)-dependent glycerol-1-phosphate dehydrogenase [bacterium (Candidatus Stahlbacteria) CG23_combo_of_CG06-09_8_20_14_all_34_7]
MYNSIDVPLFITIEDDALFKVKKILKRSNIFINNPMIITDKGISASFAEIVRRELKMKKEMVIFAGENTDKEVARTENIARKMKADFIIGVGGGLAIDISKLTSYKYGSYFISIPTLPSHDGIASPVASIIVSGMRMSLNASMPVGIIIDIKIIKKAPARFIYSGIMDLLSNISAIQDWKLSYEKGFEVRYNGFARALAYSSAENIFNFDGSDIYTEDLLTVLLNGLVLSGIAMEIAGSSRPASGAEHNFSHAFDSLYPQNTLLHGEKVGIGHLLVSYFRNKIEYGKILDCYERYGILKSFKNLNLDKEKVLRAFEHARAIRKERYSILSELKITEKEVNRVVEAVFRKIN